MARHAAMQNQSTLLRQIAEADLLIIDDFGLAPLADTVRRDLPKILAQKSEHSILRRLLDLADAGHGALAVRARSAASRAA
jgi:DNA replication protein DnaC